MASGGETGIRNFFLGATLLLVSLHQCIYNWLGGTFPGPHRYRGMVSGEGASHQCVIDEGGSFGSKHHPTQIFGGVDRAYGQQYHNTDILEEAKGYSFQSYVQFSTRDLSLVKTAHGKYHSEVYS